MIPLADVARAMFAAAVQAVQPEALLRRVTFTPEGVAVGDDSLRPAGRLVVVAIGKAAPGLASTFLRRGVRQPDIAFVLAPDGAFVPASVAAHTRLARHPVPDGRGAAATAELLALLAGLDSDDGVVLLLSGGSSALLALPLPPFAGEEIARLTSELLGRGANIHELNAVRKHVLAAAGGRLAAATRAAMLTLVLSDVPGDDLATIASGPTVADPRTRDDARAVLRRYRLTEAHADLDAALADPARADQLESPKPGDPRLARARTVLLGSSEDALAAAAAVAADAGLTPRTLTRRIGGEARFAGRTLGSLAAALSPGEGLALLAAGETTVTVTGDGCGGRNLEFALAAATVLDGVPERCLLAAGTDGVDGAAPAAGAVVDGATIARAAARGRDAADALARNNAWGFFAGLPEAIVTGPTGTNVADVAFVLVAGGQPVFVGESAVETASVHNGTAPCAPPTGPAAKS